MNLFKTFTLKWWQGGLFKWGVLAAGMVIGTYWHEVLADYLLLLIIFAFVSLAYVTYVWANLVLDSLSESQSPHGFDW
jgi:hypothetical protein